MKLSAATDSWSVSTEVGSSRMRMRAPSSSTLRISTRCCSAIESAPTTASGSMSKPTSAPLAAMAAAASRGRRTPSAARQASTMFSATVKRFTSL